MTRQRKADTEIQKDREKGQTTRERDRERERERERERARGVYYSLLASSHGWRYSSFGDGATVS